MQLCDQLSGLIQHESTAGNGYCSSFLPLLLWQRYLCCCIMNDLAQKCPDEKTSLCTRRLPDSSFFQNHHSVSIKATDAAEDHYCRYLDYTKPVSGKLFTSFFAGISGYGKKSYFTTGFDIIRTENYRVFPSTLQSFFPTFFVKVLLSAQYLEKPKVKTQPIS